MNSYAPKVQFLTPAGQTVVFSASASSSDPGYRVGDSVNVLYTPNSPEDAIINSFFHLWLGPTILVGLGGISTLLGLLIALLAFRENRASTITTTTCP